MYLGHNIRPYMAYLPILATIPLTRNQNDPGLEIDALLAL